MKAGFLDKLIERLDRVSPGEVQALLMKLVRENGFFEQVFEVLEEGMIICDPQGTVTFVNRAACGFFGLDPETSPVGGKSSAATWKCFIRKTAS